MSYLDEYYKSIPHLEIKESIDHVINDIFDKHLTAFDFQSTINGLLLGEVQSGKTGQMLGVIAAAADLGYEIFILLTADNNRLQKQTFERVLDKLHDFCVCDETDEIRYKINRMRKPLILVLKKNYRILSKWRNNLSSEGFLEGRTLFILDDEADAASLNTKVNQDDQSNINKNIEEMKNLSSSCVYLQVTATPHAVLLQTIKSGFKPSFVTYFSPGQAYLGGDFFFSRPKSYTIYHTDLEELKSLKDENEIITPGLAKAIITFLITVSHFVLKKESDVCNFIVHPSIRIVDHETIEQKIKTFLTEICHNFKDRDFQKSFKDCYEDLYRSKPDIIPLNKAIQTAFDLLFEQNINVIVLNSKTSPDTEYDKGYNIIVGALTLGRGVTFPMLQTVYYARQSKTPQIDTFWQHCRMFGYDRDQGLVRLFMPEYQHKIFQDLNNSQTALVEQIKDGNLDQNHILCLNKLRPTRLNVIDLEYLNIISGGVNYFATYPINKDVKYLDDFLNDYDGAESSSCDSKVILEILENINSEESTDWNHKDFINAIKTLLESGINQKFRIITRKNRSLTKGTGTMLSEDDRKLIKKYDDETVLVLYRVNGSKDQGWSGSPFWMPNIKLPKGYSFYNTRN